MVWCGRVSEGALRENAGGQYLHFIGEPCQPIEQARWETPSDFPHPRPAIKPATKRFNGLTRLQIQQRVTLSCVRGTHKRDVLAQMLGVSKESIACLRVGWDSDDGTWDFPELNAVGEIIGINRRYRDGRKKRVAGGQAGLTYASDWDTGNGPIFLVEGGSDTAALITVGFSVVGRPSNTGGGDLLIELLDAVPPSRTIVVVAERDEKSDGQWPGRDGAIKISQKLVQGLGREVHWALPPDNCKDSRAWLQMMRAEGIPDASLQRLFLDGLLLNTVSPPPLYMHVENNAPTVSVEAWRGLMLQSRIASLSQPGYYLDCSQTGAGKSWVDLALVLHAQHQEAA